MTWIADPRALRLLWPRVRAEPDRRRLAGAGISLSAGEA